jgi:hypothetical protein
MSKAVFGNMRSGDMRRKDRTVLYLFLHRGPCFQSRVRILEKQSFTNPSQELWHVGCVVLGSTLDTIVDASLAACGALAVSRR